MTRFTTCKYKTVEIVDITPSKSFFKPGESIYIEIEL
ncbi:unnamed protein product, partial [marine sediment metagenome]